MPGKRSKKWKAPLDIREDMVTAVSEAEGVYRVQATFWCDTREQAERLKLALEQAWLGKKK